MPPEVRPYVQYLLLFISEEVYVSNSKIKSVANSLINGALLLILVYASYILCMTEFKETEGPLLSFSEFISM